MCLLAALMSLLAPQPARSQTDVFPLQIGRHVQYDYRSSVSFSTLAGSGPSAVWKSDSGIVEYTILDSCRDDDSTCSWHVRQTYRLLHHYSDNGGGDSLFWTQDSTQLVLQEKLTGKHELTFTGLIWEFPVRPTYSVIQPISRFVDPTEALICIRYSLPGSFGEGNDSLWFAPSSGLHKRRVRERSGAMFYLAYDMSADLISVTGAKLDAIGEHPCEVMLSQNYPNPFNPSTTIRYGLPSRAHVTLAVFNTLGQQVSTLVQAEQDPGYHEVRFDGANLPSGMYFYRMQAGSFTETKKLLIVR